MKKTNPQLYNLDWMQVPSGMTDQIECAMARASNLLCELFDADARFMYSGADIYMLIGDEIVCLDDAREFNSFLRCHRYLMPGRKLSSWVYSFLLDDVLRECSVLMQQRLLELDEVEACRDVTLAAADIAATKSLIRSLVDKHGSALTVHAETI